VPKPKVHTNTQLTHTHTQRDARQMIKLSKHSHNSTFRCFTAFQLFVPAALGMAIESRFKRDQ